MLWAWTEGYDCQSVCMYYSWQLLFFLFFVLVKCKKMLPDLFLFVCFLEIIFLRGNLLLPLTIISQSLSKASLDINPATLLPTGTSKHTNLKPSSPCSKTPDQNFHNVQHFRTTSGSGSNEETGVSFDHPMQADTLQSANKVIL